MALHDSNPDFDERHGWESDEREGATALLAVLMGFLTTVAFALILAITAARTDRPAVCDGYPHECVAAASEGF